ncbi:MAG: hypothetical protein QOJ39_134, partial [Candidatus Eremiobacteraeota bacterium]|nr:hypothetical protein [Candidatus Eremiobacteraeota bacterium]
AVGPPAIAIASAWAGATRLIDNEPMRQTSARNVAGTDGGIARGAARSDGTSPARDAAARS